MILTPAELSDREAVNALAVQVHDLHVGWQPQYYQHTQLLYDEERFQKAIADGTLYVARTEGNIIGYVTIPVVDFCHNGMPPMRTMRLEELCVAEGWRGRGVGKRILEEVKSIAREKGCTDIRLTCAPQNGPAIALYESMGMEIKTLQYCLML